MSDLNGEKLLRETRESSQHTASVLEEADAVFGAVRDHLIRNHYAEKARLIMRGAH